MKSIQTFLERFNCIPFEEKPQILFQTWETFFVIQCSQPEDSNELFQKLLEDLKKLAEYDQSTSTNCPIFLNSDEGHSVQDKESLENPFNEIPISKPDNESNLELEATTDTELSSTEDIHPLAVQEPPQDSDIRQLIREECCVEVPEQQNALDSKLLLINSNSQRLDKKEHEVKNVVEQPVERGNQPEHLLSMGYEHLNITLETESDEVIESNDENLLPILSKCEFLQIFKKEHEVKNVVEQPVERGNRKAGLFLSDDSIPPGIDDPEGDIYFLEELLINDSILSHESSDSNFKDNPSIS
nr:hypothetical protein [Tanacetum cinerariifolium]